MEKIFTKKLTKKGFTLAELLIVVAIIAILVAIAAPLYMGSMDQANEAVFNSNQRAIKSAGVADILLNWESLTEDAKKATTWYASAIVEKGEIKEVSVSTAKPDDAKDSYKDWKDGEKIVATITKTDLAAPTATEPGD